MSTTPGRESKPPGRIVYFAGIFIPVLVLCLVALASVTYSDYSRLTSDARNEQSRLVNLVAASVQNALDAMNNQTASLVRESYLREFVSGRTPTSEALAQRYQSITQNAPIIYQMQLIDSAGDEQIRISSVNRTAQIAAASELQNRRDEPYFTETMGLDDSQRFISPARLIMQGGEPVEPPQALTVYAMPVFAEDGTRWGVLTVWIYSGAILQSIRDYDNPTQGELWVLNPDGYWLSGPEDVVEWGHLYPGQAQHTVRTQDPGLWARLSSSSELSFEHEGSYYSRIPVCGDMTCRITYNASTASDAAVPVNLPPSGWYIIARLPAGELAWGQVLLNNYTLWLPLTLVLVAITLLSAWVAWRHATAVTALRAHDARLFQLNDELQEQKDNLEKRVEERTTQLARATETAQAANKAKSAFLAAMSHEIRTPMYGIIGSIDVLRQSSLRPRQLEQTSLIRESADSLLAIIDDILDFSKIEADKITLESEPVLLSYVIDSACIAMTPIADRKRVRLDVYRSPSLPACIRSDAVRLRQIITNLVSNAIKFSANEEATGHVCVNFDCTSEGNLLIRVKDNGIGMDADTISVIFDSFSQADVSTTRRFGGTGLGLTITKRLVDLMNGTIDVGSAPGFGSTFTVTLPLVPEPVAATAAVKLDDVSVYLAVEDDDEAQAWTVWLNHYGASVTAVRREHLPDRVPAVTEGRTVALLSGTLTQAADIALQLILESRVQHFIVITDLPESRADQVNGVTYINRYASHNRTLDTMLAALDGNLESLEEPPERLVKAVNSLSREQARAAGRLILVAEDNEVNQDVIRNQLDALGFACDVARHGLDALALWSRNPGSYALLLTDIHMPVMDGYELTAAIRCQESGDAHLPILAFTANATKGERAHCLDCGMDDYLTKPLPLTALNQKLQQWASPPDAGAKQAPALFDTSILVASIGTDSARSQQLLRKFCAAARIAGEQISEALQDRELTRIVAVSHNLKSSSRAVGALALGDACARLEEDAKNKNNPLVEESVAAFQLALEASLEILAAHAEGHGKNEHRTITDTDDR